MVKINFSKKGDADQDVLIVPVLTGTEKLPGLPDNITNQLKSLLSAEDFQAKAGGTAAQRVAGQKIVFVGLGDREKLTPEQAKTTGAKVWSDLGNVSEKSVGLWGESVKPSILLKLTEGLLLRNYLDSRYKTGEELANAKKKLFSTLTVIADTDAALRREIDELTKITEAVHYVRDLVSAPPIDLKPEDLANEAAKLAQTYQNITCRVLNKKEIEAEGLGLLAAVNRGSAHEPRLIILEINANKKEKPIILVGKGLTFDSGGYNLKPSGGIEMMHIDMAGGATVLGTIKALAMLGSKKKVIGIVPATENLVSGEAYKPSDIIKSYSGKTVEIRNTDAEGRLILADALSYAEKNFSPALMIDLATLTGACRVALGERYAGVFSRHPEITKRLEQASKISGDKIWYLPLDELHSEQLKSKVADIANISEPSRLMGASSGAAFLSFFVKEETPWAHLDIAGPAHQSVEIEAWNPPSGATGYGVALLIDLITNW
ncbi:hypothetical protein A2V68_03000 [candidate division Kazan bacterium RBG_13_50_9]|uniref:Probable cytosol aminopeptidase n=1 Tax=candidate division Kazan bacterium RBG_13_50_9 TaxID=1798535 RepID=A0A1F4NT83_UNCK3|nr:MAG: hypothetical protein A2V68_03000 [candidate division Kazan bacterium RBG_13_50_9]